MPFFKITIKLKNGKVIEGIKRNTSDLDVMYIHYEKEIRSTYREHDVLSYDIVQVSKHSPLVKAWLKKNKAE